MNFPVTKIATWFDIKKIQQFLVVEFHNENEGIVRGTSANTHKVGEAFTSRVVCSNNFWWKQNITFVAPNI